MLKTTVPGPLDGGPFEGRSKSFTAIPGGKGWPTCRSCGSTLYPSRRESSKVRTIGGQRVAVDKYRCRCRTGREVRRLWEDALAA